MVTVREAHQIHTEVVQLQWLNGISLYTLERERELHTCMWEIKQREDLSLQFNDLNPRKTQNRNEERERERESERVINADGDGIAKISVIWFSFMLVSLYSRIDYREETVTSRIHLQWTFRSRKEKKERRKWKII